MKNPCPRRGMATKSWEKYIKILLKQQDIFWHGFCFLLGMKNCPSNFRPCIFAAAAALTLSGAAQASAETFHFSALEKRAGHLAREPYDVQMPRIPAFLEHLNPAQYAEIQDVDPYWSTSRGNFRVQFYLPGRFFPRPEKISEIVDGRARLIPLRLQDFTFGSLHPQGLSKNLGYAGFRLLYPLDNPPHHNEFISFLGGTYFRAVGQGGIYGTSARGIGIDTAQPSGEIFPYFRHVWLQKPAPGKNGMTVYALMDSSAVTGAYRFDIVPGKSTTVHVRATIFLRKPVRVLELAPLTSMFWHGQGRGVDAGDWHPAQHDSSELVMANGNGEWISRPLNNPLFTQTTTYGMDHPEGFGLVQQNRHFSAYQGITTQYQRRTSVWVQPDGDWGKGQVRLVELPTNNPNMDNIVAFWVPAQAPRPRTAFHFSYTVRFFLDNARLVPLGHPQATFLGYDTHNPDIRTVVIDFRGGALTRLPGEMPVAEHFTAANGARVLSRKLEWDAEHHFWRVIARVEPGKAPSNLRCYLSLHGQVLTDTWTYLLHPAQGGH